MSEIERFSEKFLRDVCGYKPSKLDVFIFTMGYTLRPRKVKKNMKRRVV